MNSNGCDSIIVTDLTVKEVLFNIEVIANELKQLPINGAIYEWIDCFSDEVVGNDFNYLAEENGSFKLKMTVGDCVEESTCYEINSLNTTVLDKVKINVSPNPTNDWVTVKSEKSITEIQIFDIEGRLVAMYQPDLLNLKLNFEPYKTGVYLLNVRIGGDIIVRRIMKL